MPHRTWKQDNKGPYLLWNKRKYRPSLTEASHFYAGLHQYFYGRVSGNTVSCRIPNAGYRSAVLTTTDPYVPPPSKAPKPGMDHLRTTLGGAGVIVRMNDLKAKPLRITVSSAIETTWDDWDNFVAEINKRREVLPVERIAAELQKDVDLEDELQKYIEEKGLA